MNVAIVYDPGNADGTIGGAELTMREFAHHRPNGVHITDIDQAETVVIGNCVTFGPDLIDQLEGKRVVRYFNDVDPHSNPVLRTWLLAHATVVFTSPLHRDRFPWPVGESELIPPPVNLDRFRRQRNTSGEGAVAVGSWANPGKGQVLLSEWANANEPVDVWGTGAFLPVAPNLILKGQVAYEDVPRILAGYRRHVHLPTSPEPFGRGVVEAWAAGVDLVVNRLVGAAYWIEEAPDALETAAEDFWDLVTAQVTA